MTQTITPNFDARYSVLFMARGNLGQVLTLVEEPVTAWLHQLEHGASTPSQRPLHPSAGLEGDCWLKRPAGSLVNLKTGQTIGMPSLLMTYRQEGLLLKHVNVLNPKEWGGVFGILDPD